jgi:hypothetical protein
MMRAAAPGRPKQGTANRQRRLAFVPSKPAQAGLEPRHLPLLEAEAGHKQSSGLFVACRGAGPLARCDLQGRSQYSASGELQ